MINYEYSLDYGMFTGFYSEKDHPNMITWGGLGLIGENHITSQSGTNKTIYGYISSKEILNKYPGVRIDVSAEKILDQIESVNNFGNTDIFVVYQYNKINPEFIDEDDFTPIKVRKEGSTFFIEPPEVKKYNFYEVNINYLNCKIKFYIETELKKSQGVSLFEKLIQAFCIKEDLLVRDKTQYNQIEESAFYYIDKIDELIILRKNGFFYKVVSAVQKLTPSFVYREAFIVNRQERTLNATFQGGELKEIKFI